MRDFYDCLASVVSLVRAVLAARAVRAADLSVRLAHAASVPVGGHRRRRSAGAGVGARNISCAIAQRPVSSFQNLREAATFAERKSELELHRL